MTLRTAMITLLVLAMRCEGIVAPPAHYVRTWLIGMKAGSWVITRPDTGDTLYAGPIGYATAVPLPVRSPLRGWRVGP